MKDILYHGSCSLFDKFSLSYLGRGEGKSKFGQGVYITSSYASAALYAAKAAKANSKSACYVYTVEVPVLTQDNHLLSCKAVNPDIVAHIEQTIGESIPEEATSAGKYLRKYLGNLLTGKRGTVKQMIGKADMVAENAVAKFLCGVGIVYLAWPQSQTKPDGDTNRVVLDEASINIVKIEEVEVDSKNRFIEGSAKEIKF